MFTDEEIRFTYGKTAVISRKNRFVLVHLDRPSAALLVARTEEFDPDEFFFDDCPLCQMAKEGGVVVFDDRQFEEDDLLVD
jgi:hypothetical protein